MAKGLFERRQAPLTNYDWIDFASATGYIIFDALNAIDSVGNKYLLIDDNHSTDILGLNPITTSTTPIITVVTGNSGQSTDIDFDLSPFQLPRTIEGNAFVRISVTAGAAAVTDLVITAKLRKYSAGESEIVSTTSITQTIALTEERSHTLKLIVPKTHFKKGDTLRLTILISTGDNDVYVIGHNPNDTAIRNFSTGNSRLCVAVPFKLDFM